MSQVVKAISGAFRAAVTSASARMRAINSSLAQLTKRLPLLVRRTAPGLDEADVDEIVSRLAQRGWREMERDPEFARNPHALEAMVQKAAANYVLDVRKLRARRRHRESLFHEEIDASSYGWMNPEARAIGREFDRVLHRAIQALPELRRRVYHAVVIDEMSHEQVSEALGLSLQAVKGHMVRANKQVRKLCLDYQRGLE
jgi:RNA polymerase sigma factor (sigma-70 family)